MRFNKIRRKSCVIGAVLLTIFLTSQNIFIVSASPTQMSDKNIEIAEQLTEGAEPAQIDGVYQIGTVNELYWYAQQVNSGNSAISAVLISDITVNEHVLNPDGTLNESARDSFTEWTPIGTYSAKFKGQLNGNGHTVSGLYITSTAQYQGLVGYMDGGKIQNLTVADSYFSSTSYVGGICANNNKGSIENCVNRSTVEGLYSSVGGICGYNTQGTILNCSNMGNVSSNSGIGGVCGYNYGGTIENSTNCGSITGRNSTTGGICGSSSSKGTIRNCSNSGDVFGAATVSGICGSNTGTISDCINSGEIQGTGNYVAGICAQSSNSSNVIRNCSNTGMVKAGNGNYVSGICGYNSGLTENCSNSAAVAGNGDYIGGVCGYNNYQGIVKNCINVQNVDGSTANTGSVCGYNYNSYLSGTVENCYFLSGTADAGIGSGEGEAIEKTKEQFTSGEVTWLLNGQSAEAPVWFQTLGKEGDLYPILDDTHKIVYKVGDKYSNSEKGDPSYSVEYCQLSIDRTIGLSFFVWLGENANPGEFQMKFILPNGTTELTEADGRTEELNGLTYHVFTARVAAKEMTKDIIAQLLLNGEPVGESCAYSVKDYADVVIANESGSYTEEQINYVKNMLNFGGYVQQYFSYNTTDLANTDVKNDISLDCVTNNLLLEYNPTLNMGNVTGLSYYGSTLLLNSDTVIRHYFQLQSGKSIEDYTFRYGDMLLHPVWKGGRYYVDIPGLPADELNTMCQLRVTQAGVENPLSITYGVYSYIYHTLLRNTAEKDFARALYLYGEAVLEL